jgi:hypothetical protein
MNMNVDVKLNLKIDQAVKDVTNACKLAMRDTTVEVTHDAVGWSPWITGNNRRSIVFGVSGMGHTEQARQADDTWTGKDESLLDNSKIEGVVYSSSGYGGYLETGTSKMAARPYIKPSADKNFTESKYAQKVKGYLK